MSKHSYRNTVRLVFKLVLLPSYVMMIKQYWQTWRLNNQWNMLLWDRMLIKSVGTPLNQKNSSWDLPSWASWNPRGWNREKQNNVSNKTSYDEHGSAAGKEIFFSNGIVKNYFFIVLCSFLTSEMLSTAIFLLRKIVSFKAKFVWTAFLYF